MFRMAIQVGVNQVEHITVSTPVYEGPLDLLLDLIERAELDITRLALAQVTDQYLAYLRSIEDYDPAEVSSFLVIAAKLIQIKSEALLRHPPIREIGEEDPGESLTNQLILYKKFKDAARMLAEMEEAHLTTYLHTTPPIKIDTNLDLSDVTLEDLARAALDLILSHGSSKFLGNVISLPRITIRQKINEILKVFKQSNQTSFNNIIQKTGTRLEVVVTFLAMLELVKQRMIETRQEDLFGDIQLTLVTENTNQEFELEFE
jgi:segregation and condensation protein A